MNGNSLLLDTNIILYLLAGNQTVADFLNNKTVFVSFVTELELLGYDGLESEGKLIVENLLEDSTIIDINSEIKKVVIELRKAHKIKLPDAIIAATAFYLNIPLMTSDKRLSKLKELNILLFEK
ncbi:type II toxin-antitoxin system VapC family toxin [Algoriphagus aquimarinus]|uniref:Type II toxin-antitoxin system VapC family toxin n=1 Tax=Algoriphagus aquimarinus TaxID=237018 RepID=A0A5C7B0Z3_9BACT|nr:type II toxin-antitoxin system VapC family toxin [Algoriphagus aquimarinus]TXE14538.1 type II toxin-antitoxin system VapC family toxin [Algoriphagus aquimarinus]